jgi:hypothetical protein
LLVPALILALAAAASPRSGLPAGVQEPMTDRCHMGECGWFAELDRETVRETAAGRLIRMRLYGGRSAVAEGEDYSESWGPNARVEWDGEPHQVWIFCSTRLPAVMIGTESGLQADVLNFVDGTPPVQESSRRVYVYACHGREGDEIENFAEHFHYQVPPVEELELARPEDIFDRLR